MLAAHRVHMAPMDPMWLLRGCFWVPLGLHMAAQRLHMAARGSMWLLRGCTWEPLGLHMAAQRLHMAAHWAAYGGSEAAFGCRGVAFCCTGAVYGSYAADMQYMLRLAGPGWAARILRRRPGDGSQGGLGTLILHPGWGIKDQGSTIKAQG